MLHTTFNKCHKARACPEGYRKLAEYLGGVKKYGEDKPIPLSVIVESNGLMDAVWTLRCTIEPSEDVFIEFACRCAEHVLHFYEDKYPDDKRPRKAIEAARVCITDKSPAAVWAAGAAAWAAWTAAWAARTAAWAAWTAWVAWDVAWAAEIEWQTKTFLELLEVK